MWNLRRIRPGAARNAVAKARCVSPAVLAWVLAVVPTLVAAQESATDRESITLADAIARALERSPALAQSRSSLESAESGRLTAYGSFLPTVSAGSGASLQSQNRFDPNTQTTLTGSEDSYSSRLHGRECSVRGRAST
jgi:outer membrane protein TolC